MGQTKLGSHVPGTGVMVPCRDCGEQVEISAFAAGLARGAAKDRLVQLGQPPLKRNELTRCEPCGEKWRARELQEAWGNAEHAAKLIRAGKATGKLSDFDRRWMIDNGYRESVEALENLWAKPNPDQRRRREEDV